jgi:uncharacterized membrane protein
MTHFNIPDKHLQTIAHLYRAEINRLTIYRQRLDIISNWYISILSTVLVLYLGNTMIQHNMILILFLPNIFFSFIEARRYRYYMISQYRTRLIEKGFYYEILDLEKQDDKNYKYELYNSLVKPEYNITLLHAWIVRFKRNYIWLIYLILFSWILKLAILNLIRTNIIIISLIPIIIIIFHLCINHIKNRDEIDI